MLVKIAVARVAAVAGESVFAGRNRQEPEDMTTRIVILDGLTLSSNDNPWDQIEQLGKVTRYDETAPGEVIERLQGAAVAVVNKVPLSAEVLEQLPQLKLIAVTATGYDCVHLPTARAQGITVCNVPTYGTDSVAQFAFALLLELCHQVGRHDGAVRAGDWQRAGTFSFWQTPQIELAGLTLGVIGFGRIGRRVAEIGRAFGMKILACDEYHGNPPDWPSFRWASADEIAAGSDVVTLHCNLTETSRKMVDAGFLLKMKPTAFLITAARGGLVDEPALAEALNAGRLAGAGLDVVSAEPIRDDNPLLKARNCLLTPHMAWSTLAARRRIMATTCDNIREFLAGCPGNVVRTGQKIN